MSRGKFVGLIAAAGVFVVGAVTVVHTLGAVTGKLAKEVTSKPVGQVASVQNANFSYWVPGSDTDWTYDPKSIAVDSQHGVITYAVKFAGGDVTQAKISQQRMPDPLKPVGGVSWKHFIQQEKPVTNQSAGDGTIYYLPALANGTQVSDGSDTIIFASDDILLFGQSTGVLKAAQWSKLIGSMTKRSAQ
jgi:hypothetical protein